MAPTKRKRRSKHRGTAAGNIESRGRTGRKPAADERKPSSIKEARAHHLDRPPTWRSATIRAVLATAIFLAIVLLAFQQPLETSLALGCFTLAVYIPLGYYTDQYLYKRRQRKKAEGR